MTSESAFDQSLAHITDAAHIFQDHWVLIGSAAAKLAGADVGRINDIDILLSVDDFHRLKKHWDQRPTLLAETSAQFRSQHFCRYDAPLPIEAMAEFELKNANGAWIKIEPKTRQQYGALYAPEISEQIEILNLMGREKDTPRIAALKQQLS